MSASQEPDVPEVPEDAVGWTVEHLDPASGEWKVGVVTGAPAEAGGRVSVQYTSGVNRLVDFDAADLRFVSFRGAGSLSGGQSISGSWASRGGSDVSGTDDDSAGSDLSDSSGDSDGSLSDSHTQGPGTTRGNRSVGTHSRASLPRSPHGAARAADLSRAAGSVWSDSGADEGETAYQEAWLHTYNNNERQHGGAARSSRSRGADSGNWGNTVDSASSAGGGFRGESKGSSPQRHSVAGSQDLGAGSSALSSDDDNESEAPFAPFAIAEGQGVIDGVIHAARGLPPADGGIPYDVVIKTSFVAPGAQALLFRRKTELHRTKMVRSATDPQFRRCVGCWLACLWRWWWWWCVCSLMHVQQREVQAGSGAAANAIRVH